MFLNSVISTIKELIPAHKLSFPRIRVKTDEYGAMRNRVAGTGQPAWASRTLRPIAFIKLLFPLLFTPNNRIPDSDEQGVISLSLASDPSATLCGMYVTSVRILSKIPCRSSSAHNPARVSSINSGKQ